MLKGFVHYLFIVALLLPFFHQHEQNHGQECHAQVEQYEYAIGAANYDESHECDLCAFLLSFKKLSQNAVGFLPKHKFFELNNFQSPFNIKSTLYFIDGNRSPPQII